MFSLVAHMGGWPKPVAGGGEKLSYSYYYWTVIQYCSSAFAARNSNTVLLEAAKLAVHLAV